MKQETLIGWTDFSLNPWIGCTRISPACLHCYAAEYGKRFGIEFGQGKPRKQTSKWQTVARSLNRVDHRCSVCGRWMPGDNVPSHVSTCCKDARAIRNRKPSAFCGSLMDLFDPEIDPKWRDEVFRIIAECDRVFWLLLTKRPQLAGAYFRRLPDQPWPNIALGVTAENQELWNQRVGELIRIPAMVRFVSVEPMLGPISPSGIKKLDWVIIGGESGKRARQTDTEWIRALMNQIKAHSDAAVMVKQLGADPTCSSISRGDFRYFENMRDSHGANPAEWPKDLRVQQILQQLPDGSFVKCILK